MREIGADFPELLSVITRIEPDSLKVTALDRLALLRESSATYPGMANDGPGRSNMASSGHRNNPAAEIPTVAGSDDVSSDRGDRTDLRRLPRFNILKLYWRSRLNFKSGSFEYAAADAGGVIELLALYRGKLFSDETDRMLIFQAAGYALASGEIGRAEIYAAQALNLSDRAGDVGMVRAVNDLQSKIYWTQNRIGNPVYK